MRPEPRGLDVFDDVDSCGIARRDGLNADDDGVDTIAIGTPSTVFDTFIDDDDLGDDTPAPVMLDAFIRGDMFMADGADDDGDDGTPTVAAAGVLVPLLDERDGMRLYVLG